MNLQDAQDLIQEQGVFYSRRQDATGRGRMQVMDRAGRQGEALGAYRRARSLLADELGLNPAPELRRLEAAIVARDSALEMPVAQQLPTIMRAVTFLLTDIEGSTAAWEADADGMALALARHDELVERS